MVLFIILVTFILLYLLLILLIRKGLSRSVMFIILMWWMIWIIYSTFNPFNLYDVSAYTYSLLMLSLIMFFMGYTSCEIVNSKSNVRRVNEQYLIAKYDKLITNNKVVIVIFLLEFLILALFYMRYRQALTTYGILYSRTLRFTIGTVFKSSMEAHFFNYILTAGNYISLSVIACSILFKRVRSLTFIISCLNVFLFAGIGSGRGIIISCCCFIMFAFLVNQNSLSKQLKAKPHKKINLFLLLTVNLSILGYTAYLTALRMGYNTINSVVIKKVFSVLTEQVATYCVGSFRALDYAIEVKTFEGLSFFGSATLGGIDQLIGTVMSLIGIDYSVSNYVIDNVKQIIIMIGATVEHNALYTQILPFYLDFGIIGIVIFSYLFGLCTSKAINTLLKKPSLPNMMLCMILFDAMIRGILNWQLGSGAVVIVFVLIFIWSRKTKETEVDTSHVFITKFKKYEKHCE